MSVGATTRIERAIMSVLSQPGPSADPKPLTGLRSYGTVIVRSTSGSVVLPANSYAEPVIASASTLTSVDPHRLVKTREAVTVTTSGVEVPIMSMCGGSDTNLAVGTQLRWDPPIPNIESASTLTAALTGGVTYSEPGQIRRILAFEGIGQGEAARAFWAAQGPSQFPAAVVSWESASEGVAKGRGRQLQEHRFRLYVVVSRLESDAKRRNEGKAILDAAREILCDRTEADGEIFSAPPISLGTMGRAAFAPTSYVYFVDFTVSHTTVKRELRAFADWTKTREVLTTHASTGYTADELTVVDQSHDMPTPT